MLFKHLRNRAVERAATRRVLLFAAVGSSGWIALWVCCFANLSALPSALNTPRCQCEPVQSQARVPREAANSSML
jgi:hypothetical protein